MSTEIEIVAELKSRFNDLSNFQALHIACEIRRNNILQAAFLTDGEGVNPNREVLAEALGIKRKKSEAQKK